MLKQQFRTLVRIEEVRYVNKQCLLTIVLPARDPNEIIVIEVDFKMNSVVPFLDLIMSDIILDGASRYFAHVNIGVDKTCDLVFNNWEKI